MTDDPEPVEYKHSEFYVFSTYDGTRDGSEATLPGFEFNYGIFPNTQFHVVLPITLNSPTEGKQAYGFGDIELGIKYRFVEETESRPMIGIFPMAEIDTGNPDRSLGNGKTWWRLPVWVQKSWGDWKTYGGGGYAINNAPGETDYPFGGWLLQKNINEQLTLGGEIFARGKDTEDGNYTYLLNFGGYYNFTPAFSLLFSAGHSGSGESHTIAYLGLYWTWGKDDKETHASSGQKDWAISHLP